MEWGAFLAPYFTNGHFTCFERDASINMKELLGIWFAVLSFLPLLCRSHILIRTDNTMALSYVHKMGGMKDLFKDYVARLIWDLAMQHDFWITISYIRGVSNFVADWASRHLQSNLKWTLPRHLFIKICEIWGFPQIDLFASRLNAQLPNYISWSPDPYCVQVDAFTVSWADQFLYAFPPFILLSRTLKKIIVNEAELLLIVPCWPNQPWFPRALELLTDFPRILPRN